MLYFANPSRGPVADAMTAGRIGCITTPAQGNIIPTGAHWCADNGKYGDGWPGEHEWFAWLTRTVHRYGPERCWFATAPDTVGDPWSTYVHSWPWLRHIRALGIPAAYVAQDGAQEQEWYIPWGQFDVLFLGGSTAWKLSEHARLLTAHALATGHTVHMGRVNSRKRFRMATAWGCASADGTYLTRGRDTNFPKLLAWAKEADEPTLF